MRYTPFGLKAPGGRLTPAPVAVSLAPAGTGPRHLAFRPRGGVLSVDELSSTLSWYDFDPDSGALTWCGSVPTTDEVGGSPNYPSEVVLGPDGRFGYVANRGRNTIAAFDLTARGVARVGSTQPVVSGHSISR